MRTRIFLLCTCVVSYIYSIAQPANNACSNAVAITALDGTCLTGQDVSLATEDIGSGACTVGANENVWFSFVAQGPSVEINVNNGPGAPEITLLYFTPTDCNPANAFEIDCSNTSVLTVDGQLTVGNVYYVMVAFSNNMDGTFDICVNNPEPAPNDACITAEVISNVDNACINTSNDFPSTDVLIPSCFTGSTYNVWYSFTAIGVSLDVHISPGGPGPAQVAVFDFVTDCVFAGNTQLGCATGTNHVILDNVLIPGNTYYIVAGFSNSDFDGTGIGDFELCVDNPIPTVNDDCNDAIVIPSNVLDDPTTCFTTIAGNPLNNDWPSTDVLNFNCWNPGDTYNIWYSFVAQGPDVQITVDPVFPEDAQIALVEFTGAPCSDAGAAVLDCANGEVLDFNDELEIGQTYYIAVGFENNTVGNFCMNVFNPEPPPNDLPCDAIALSTDGSCVDGTTVYANPEVNNVPPPCQSAHQNVVWYELNFMDPESVGYEIDVDFENVTPGMTVSIILFPVTTDCNSLPNPAFFYCDDPPTEPIEFGPLDETLTYLLWIGTSEANETDFEVCVDEIPPCFMNDDCMDATVINNVQSDMPFVCIDGCNLYADPETFNNACEIGNFSTVWFTLQTDGAATLMNIQVQSDDFDAPTITLFQQITDCSDIQQILQTTSNLPCVVGSNGEAESFGTDVGASTTYFIAVSSLNNVGGEFELCVNTISQASACVADRDIEIVSRSSGGPLEGPFFPGETVSICMNVNSYTAANNGCQWFQGIIPVFGNGWDPNSFDADGQPLNATVNGNPMGAANNGIYSTATWDWFTDVDYHHDHFFYQLGDFDGNGTTDMCNTLYDPDCPDNGGLNGGCCNPCWGTPLGTILPGGWFAYNIDGSCPGLGPPVRVDWGDGNTCGGGMGPWSFCFDLNVREYPECLEDASTMTLSLGFFTTADGETGAWTGSASICALDQPAFLTLPMCCSELAEGMDMLDPICSEQQFVYAIDEPDVDYWEWTVDAGPVSGATPGAGGPGTLIINTLVNNGSDPEIVTYTFLGFAGGACPVFQKEVTIEVFPKIQATIDPVVMCATPTEPYTIAPDVTGGTGNYEYQWSPGNQQTSSIQVPNPVNGTTYTVSITDEVGCFTTASVTIQVYTTFPVDIVAPVVEQCLQDGPITITGVASGGMDPYSFEWTTPSGSSMEDEITTTVSGQYVLTVTDDEGCRGRDSVMLTLNESPEIYIDAVGGILAICENESTELTGVGSGGEGPYIYEWSTPDGPESGKTIEAFTPGLFSVTVEDNNGCTNEAELEILAQPEPEPDLGPDQIVCNFDDPAYITVIGDFEDYFWSVGSGADGETTIETYNPGTYTITVTNEYGCQGTDEMEITTFTQPVFPLPDTFEFCPGSSVMIDGDDYDGPWENYLWSQFGSANLFETDIPGTYNVTVYDINGCTVQEYFTVVENANIDPGLNGDNIICTGETITLSAGAGFVSYDWTGGGQTQTIDITAPGSYSVTVVDAEGCFGADTIVVTSGDFTTSITGPTSICANVLATLGVSGSYTSYVWSNGDVTPTTMVDDGTHGVTVTNSNGCTASASITISEQPFVPVITGDNMICQTSESTVLDAGPGAMFVWSPNAGGATTQTITTSTAGLYAVTVTDASGCVGTASFTVANHPVPFVSITGNPDFCVGGNTQLTATAGFPTYLWSNNDPAATITINAEGPYTVTITDGNGCTNTATSTVNPPYQETVEITGSVTFCPGDQATLEVDPTYTSITWSTGETTPQIIVSTTSEVSVIVVDADGCIAFDTVQTMASSVLTPNIVGPIVICDAGPGMLNAGAGYDSYTWAASGGGIISGSTTGQNISISAAGTYSVTVTDGSCMGTDQHVVTANMSPFANVTSTATACNKQEPGGPSTIVNFAGLITGGDIAGTWTQTGGPATVNLGGANVNFDGLAAGVYTFTYTTASAAAPCVNASYPLTVTVSDCACPAIALNPAPDLCNDLGSIDLNTILTAQTQTGGNWSIVSGPGGSNPATLTGSTFNALNSDPGSYTISYMLNGLPSYCTDEVSATIMVLPKPNAGIALAPPVFCAGENQTVDLYALLEGEGAGGTWVEVSQQMSTGGAFNAAAGRFNVVAQASGTYTFNYVINGPGPCPDDMVTVEVVIEANPQADAGSTAILDCTETSTVLGGPGSSLGPEFSYSWTTDTGELSDDDILNPIASAAGTYTLTVMNTLTGCTATDVVIIDQVGEFPTSMNLQVNSPDCEGDPPGSANVMAVTGGVGPYMYSLNGQTPVSSPNFTNLPAGDYSLMVTDASGCTLTEEFTIEELVYVDLDIINYVGDTLIYAFGDTVKLSFVYSGSSDTPDSLVWKFGQDSVLCINCPVLEFVADLAGQITLEAYDVRGCAIEKSITFLVVRKRDVYIPNIFSPNGDGLNDMFTMFTDADVEEISVMEIYTRWGELVFSNRAFLPNDESEGWDGTFKGEVMMPGVYVYRMQIRYGDGLVDNLAGDVTVVR